MRDYELTLIINPEIPEENLAPILDKLSQFVAQKGGSMGEVNHWGKRKLAYPIKHLLEGNYFFAPFKLEATTAAELEANLRISEEVLRHLLVRVGD